MILPLILEAVITLLRDLTPETSLQGFSFAMFVFTSPKFTRCSIRSFSFNDGIRNHVVSQLLARFNPANRTLLFQSRTLLRCTPMDFLLPLEVSF